MNSSAAACSEADQPPNRGYIDFASETVDWHGWRAVYSLAERDLMRGLPKREALVIHQLKALFVGSEILDPSDPCLSAPLYSDCSQNDERPVPAEPKRRRNEPLPGQSRIAA